MLINLVVLTRVILKKRGVSTVLYIQTIDLKAAVINTSNVPNIHHYRQVIQATGYGFNKDDVIYLAENIVGVISIDNEDEDDILIDSGFPSPGLGN